MVSPADHEVWRIANCKPSIYKRKLKTYSMTLSEQAIVHYYCGCDLRDDEHDIEAIWEFEEALKFDPNMTNAHINIAECSLRLNRYSIASEHSQKALKLEPDNPLAHFNNGLSLLLQDQYESAVWEFDSAVHIAPDWNNSPDVGLSLCANRKLQKWV